MITLNHSPTLTYEAPLNPPSTHNEYAMRKFIYGVMEDLAESIMLRGVESSRHSKANEDLIDWLYEQIEDNIDQFKDPEVSYDFL